MACVCMSVPACVCWQLKSYKKARVAHCHAPPGLPRSVIPNQLHPHLKLKLKLLWFVFLLGAEEGRKERGAGEFNGSQGQL